MKTPIFDPRRGHINAAKNIINNGLESYFNSGVRFGFFAHNENAWEIANAIIDWLLEQNDEVCSDYGYMLHNHLVKHIVLNKYTYGWRDE